MKRFNHLLLLFFCFFLLQSCLKGVLEEAVKSPNFPEKIVLISYLTPDLPEQQIYVSLTSKIGDSVTTKKIALGAEVYIRDLSKSDSLAVIRKKTPVVYFFDQKDFPLENGKKYRVTVRYKNKLYFGETTIPPKKAVFSKIEYFVLEKDEYIKKYKVNLSWIDLDSLNTFSYLYNLKRVDYNYDRYFSDSYENQNFKFFAKTTLYFDLTKPISDYTIECMLLTIDKHFNLFLKKSNSYDELSRGFSFLDQIFSGTYPEYSNVRNGVGVVGSYRIHTTNQIINGKM